MNENVDIIICTHKDFTPIVTNKIYKIGDSRQLKKNFKICGILDDIELSEFYMFLYIYEHFIIKDYIGFCHYRRYFEFIDDVPNMDELFKEYDAVARTPINFEMTIKEQYASCHNIEDLFLLGDIIKDLYPNYYNAYIDFLNGHLLIPCNMFIMKKEDFLKYMAMLKELMKEYFWRWGINCEQKITENKEKYLKTKYPSDTIDYQKRIFSFIFERFTSFYILSTFKKIKFYDVKITENKYNVKGEGLI